MYAITRYPDGQISVKITGVAENFTFKINSYEDLFILASIHEAIVHLGYTTKNIIVTIPCMFGQRSDRRFTYNQSHDLKVICSFLNSLHLFTYKIYDPHSDVVEALLNRVIIDHVNYAGNIECIIKNDTMLISPDAGAYKKVAKLGDTLKRRVIAASKVRIDDKIIVDVNGDVNGKNCLIIDDILDGGGTFAILSSKLKELGAAKVELYVSHAYFNKGVDFCDTIDHYYCTDSVLPEQYRNHPLITVL